MLQHKPCKIETGAALPESFSSTIFQDPSASAFRRATAGILSRHARTTANNEERKHAGAHERT